MYNYFVTNLIKILFQLKSTKKKFNKILVDTKTLMKLDICTYNTIIKNQVSPTQIFPFTSKNFFNLFSYNTKKT